MPIAWWKRGLSHRARRLSNLIDLKDLAKTLPSELQEDYARWWLAAERNPQRPISGPLASPRYGDTANLWT